MIGHSMAHASADYLQRFIHDLPATFNPRKLDANDWAVLAGLAGVRRFRPLISVREYAAERLAEGDEEPDVRRHLGGVLSLRFPQAVDNWLEVSAAGVEVVVASHRPLRPAPSQVARQSHRSSRNAARVAAFRNTNSRPF